LRLAQPRRLLEGAGLTPPRDRSLRGCQSRASRPRFGSSGVLLHYQRRPSGAPFGYGRSDHRPCRARIWAIRRKLEGAGLVFGTRRGAWQVAGGRSEPDAAASGGDHSPGQRRCLQDAATALVLPDVRGRNVRARLTRQSHNACLGQCPLTRGGPP
jgi:hypothetical protein